MFIYKYDYLSPQKYKYDYYENPITYNLSNIYGVKDTLWDTYGSNISENIKDRISTNIIINPKDPGFHQNNDTLALYEIFGKYVLNKYDIDSDFELANEVRSYFDKLYDKDGRMRLELNLDSNKRKYVY